MTGGNETVAFGDESSRYGLGVFMKSGAPSPTYGKAAGMTSRE